MNYSKQSWTLYLKEDLVQSHCIFLWSERGYWQNICVEQIPRLTPSGDRKSVSIITETISTNQWAVPKGTKKWRHINWLIIDEISVVLYLMLHNVHLQQLKQEQGYFGSLSVLFGKLMQLLPVRKTSGGSYCFCQLSYMVTKALDFANYWETEAGRWHCPYGHSQRSASEGADHGSAGSPGQPQSPAAWALCQ